MKLSTILIVSAVATALMMVIMMIHGAPLHIPGVSPLGIINLELAGTLETSNNICNQWQQPLMAVAKKNTLLDFLFIFSYTAFLYAASVSATRNFNNGLHKAGRIVAIGAVVAGGFDILENILLLSTLVGHTNKEIVASTFVFAAFKFLLAAIVILFILTSIVSRFFMHKKKPAPLTDSIFL